MAGLRQQLPDAESSGDRRLSHEGVATVATTGQTINQRERRRYCDSILVDASANDCRRKQDNLGALTPVRADSRKWSQSGRKEGRYLALRSVHRCR
ncbi:uncharacterized protein LDX57_011888 [Aspergillus melleus]|uniref:uncharacterized protein n=1 Tax=Aspergillus melleus TaxID=138277 RepID=UPI001E8D3A5D|nr:uncharacterized protein LDX57_011888 [Aspergillus melleus]KAH8434250.1 hypothetical protein LDX57_011888 [Aspergillus melleus]